MATLRNVTICLFAILAIYTFFVVSSEGANFVPVFVRDILSVTWSGQFNLDFISYLTLTAFWVAWRHRFSAAGIVLALMALVGGILFFAPYLLYAINNARGDFPTLLLGGNQAHTNTSNAS